MVYKYAAIAGDYEQETQTSLSLKVSKEVRGKASWQVPDLCVSLKAGSCHPGTNLYMWHFPSKDYFANCTVTVTALNLGVIHSYSIQFEQVKCTLPGTYTVAVLYFGGV